MSISCICAMNMILDCETDLNSFIICALKRQEPTQDCGTLDWAECPLCPGLSQNHRTTNCRTSWSRQQWNWDFCDSSVALCPCICLLLPTIAPAAFRCTAWKGARLTKKQEFWAVLLWACSLALALFFFGAGFLNREFETWTGTSHGLEH